jgi:transposase InsO family protein
MGTTTWYATEPSLRVMVFVGVNNWVANALSRGSGHHFRSRRKERSPTGSAESINNEWLALWVLQIDSERGLPEAIVLDNGLEFRGRARVAWTEERGVRLEFIQQGKPAQNAYAKSVPRLSLGAEGSGPR